MSPSLMLRMGWRNLWRNRRRTVLTLVSISFGLLLAILLTALQDRNWADMIDLAARLGGGHVTVQHPELIDAPTLDKTVQRTDAIVEMARAEPEVRRVVVRIVGQTLLATASNSRGAAFMGIDPTQEDSTTLAVVTAFAEGSMFPSADGDGIVLGSRLAENLGVTLGKKVVYNLTDKDGEIVAGLAHVSGIVHTGAPSVDGGLALLPLNTLRRALGYAPDEATQVAIFIRDQRRSDEVAARLGAELPGGAVAVPWHENQPELAGFIAMKVGGANFMKILIAVLIAAGIFNTLFVSVTERMREFGIMLAIGYAPRDIHLLVMIESLWLGLVGLVVGALLTAGPYLWLNVHGIDMSAMVGDGSSEIAGVAVPSIMRVEIFPGNAVFIAVAALVATLAAGIYPAWKAGRVAPVETIRLV
jgi:ABC-type lipoprotein release transport system permease subunit